MAGFRNEGLSGRPSEVDVNNNLTVNLPVATSQSTLNTQTGYLGVAAVNHDGLTGATKVVRTGEVSINKRLRVGYDSPMFQDSFQYTSQYSGIWNVSAAVAAITWGTNDVVFINSASATGATNVVMTTWKYFPLYNGSGLSLEFNVILPQATDATTTVEIGSFQAVSNTAVQDGVLFRWNNNTLLGVTNYNGTETTVNLGTVPSVNVMHEYEIAIEQELASFWVDGALLGSIATPTSNAGPALSTYQPITIRTIGTSTTVASIKLGEVRCTLLDIQSNRPWSLVQAGFGNMGSQAPGGITQGSTAYMANNLAVGAGVILTNTTQATYVGLGGQFDVQPTLTSNMDGILCYYQVPAASATIPGKSLVITGIRIQSVVTTNLTNAAAVQYVYSLAYGATALSFLTPETAGGSSTTKAPRRVPLGQEVYAINALAGTLGSTNPIQFTPLTPIMVNQGEFVAIAVKNTGTVTSAGVITILVTFDSYWE